MKRESTLQRHFLRKWQLIPFTQQIKPMDFLTTNLNLKLWPIRKSSIPPWQRKGQLPLMVQEVTLTIALKSKHNGEDGPSKILWHFLYLDNFHSTRTLHIQKSFQISFPIYLAMLHNAPTLHESLISRTLAALIGHELADRAM